MRSYQSGTNDKKKLGKKVGYAIALILALGALTTVVVLSLTLGKTPIVPPDQNPPVDEIPSDGDPETSWVLPIAVYEIGQEASLTRVVYSASMNYWRTHNGIDFVADSGSSVMAISDGTVLSVQHTVLEASVIAIDHGDGLVSYYKGLNQDVKVEAGDKVKAGDVIGAVAEVMPFEREVGAHLHLEMKKDGKFIDPATHLSELSDK